MRFVTSRWSKFSAIWITSRVSNRSRPLIVAGVNWVRFGHKPGASIRGNTVWSLTWDEFRVSTVWIWNCRKANTFLNQQVLSSVIGADSVALRDLQKIRIYSYSCGKMASSIQQHALHAKSIPISTIKLFARSWKRNLFCIWIQLIDRHRHWSWLTDGERSFKIKQWSN